MLHTVNKSAHVSSLLHSCLSTVQPGDGVLLLGDGVYGGTHASPCADQINTLAADRRCVFYALRADAEKREVAPRLLPCIALVDFPEFVDLVARHRHTHSWY
jgi:sulfur relay protein TusB/DsrH